MANITIPRSFTNGRDEDIRWTNLLRSATMRDLANGTNFLAVAKMARSASNVITASEDTETTDGGTFTDRTEYCLIRPSTRARYLAVELLYKAVSEYTSSLDDPTLNLSLIRVSDGTVLDAGFEVGGFDFNIGIDSGAGFWLDRFLYVTPDQPRLNEGLAMQGIQSRPLVVPAADAGNLLMVKAECHNMLISQFIVQELVVNPQPQEIA